MLNANLVRVNWERLLGVALVDKFERRMGMYKINAYFGQSYFGYVRVPGTSDVVQFDTTLQANEYAKTVSAPPGIDLRVELVE